MQFTDDTEPQRTALNAIMTAWQCGGQGFESPQLHPSDQAVLRWEGGLSRLWLQFACGSIVGGAGVRAGQLDKRGRGFWSGR